MRHRLIWTIAILLAVAAIAFVSNGTFAANLTAEEIVRKSLDTQVFKLNKVKADITLIDIDQRKRTKTKKLVVKAMRGKDGLMRAIMHFLAPDDIKGTGFLTIERKGANDDQFLYLPALKKVKRIRSDQKSNSFMGTQFSYGDLQSREVEDHTHKLIGEEKVGNRDCYVIESIPKRPKEEQYGKIVAWIDKQTLVPLRLKMFDKRGKLYKVLSTENVSTVDGKYVITKATMRNMKNKKATQMIVENIDTKIELSDSDFTQTRLEKF